MAYLMGGAIGFLAGCISPTLAVIIVCTIVFAALTTNK
jgi:hypothetical protein